MTQKDLKIEYTNLAGYYPPEFNIPDLPSAKEIWKERMEDYVKWLEESLVAMHNHSLI